MKDFKGNILGKVDKDGNIVDKDGNIIGKAGAERRLALDKDGKVIGYVDENGRVIDENGNVLGMVDKDGNIIGVNGDIIGSVGEAKNLAYDKDGNIIGYVGENGEVRDFAGNTLGYVDDNGNILNNTGEIIGSVGKNGKLAYDKDGNAVAEEEVHTAGKPHHIELTADRDRLKADGKDLSFINVRVVDKNGNLCPDATHKVKFNVRGSGSYRAAANGDPSSLESFQAPQMSLFKGQLTAVVQTEETPGVIVFEASASGVKSAKIELISE